MLLMALSVHAASQSPCRGISAEPKDAIAALKGAFHAHDYACALSVAKEHGQHTALLTGRDGIDTRFALREAAAELAADAQYPAEPRRELAKAAAWTLHPHPSGQPRREEIHADVRMLVTVANNFLKEQFRGAAGARPDEDILRRERLANWLDVFLAAVALDRRLPETQRALNISMDFHSDALSESLRLRLYAPMAQLAVLVHDDKPLQAIRPGLARALYFSAYPWQEHATKELVLERSQYILKLIELLADACGGQCVSNWHWKPTMNVGVAYYRIGMKPEADKLISTALSLVRAIENPDHRLGQYQSAFTDLLVSKYDREVLRPLVKEMWQLANSRESAMAKEVRQRLPDTLKRWGLSELLE